MTIESAYLTLQDAMRKDFSYAWARHCNIAMVIADNTQITPREANIAAAQVMRQCFDIDVTDSWDYRVAVEIVN